MATFGRIPRPPIVDRTISNSENQCWDDLGPRRPVGTVVHLLHGTLWGTDGYFRNEANCIPASEPGGLTDFAIGGVEDVGEPAPAGDGVIWQWNDPEGTRSPYASGTVNPVCPPGSGIVVPSLDRNGQAFVNQASTVNDVNKRLVSIELSGFAGVIDVGCSNDGTSASGTNTPMTEKQFQALCWLIAYFHDRVEVPWESFPRNPNFGNVVTCLEHWEFALKSCPYAYVRGKRETYLARAREIMKFYQTGGTHATPPPGITLDEEPPDDNPIPGDRRFRVNYRVKTTSANVNLRADAGTNMPIVRSGLALGTGLCITGYPKARSDGLWYPVLLTGGSPANGFIRGDLLQLVKNPGYNCGSREPEYEPGDRVKTRSRVSMWSSTGISDPGDPPFNGMEPSDPIEASTRTLPEAALAIARRRGSYRISDLKVYLDEVYRLCKRSDIGLDASIIVAQSAHETAYWGATDPAETNGYWNTSLNPAGLGITYDGEESVDFVNGLNAARAHVVHMYGYVKGNISSGHVLYPYRSLDPRWDALVSSGNLGTVDTIDDLSGKWATDPNYGTGIANTGNAIFGEALESTVTLAPRTRIRYLAKGTELCVKEGPIPGDNNAYEWYQVRHGRTLGYVVSKYIRMYRSNACSAPNPDPTGPFAVGDQIETLDEVNYRATPGVIGNLLGTFPSGAELCLLEGPDFVLSDNYPWYRVNEGWLAGSSEWCALVGKNICSDPPPPLGLWAIGDSIWVSDPPVNLRADYSTSAQILTLLESGVEVCVLDGPRTNNGFEWYYVKYGTVEGWVAGEYFSLAGHGRCHVSLDNGRFKANDVIQVSDTDGLRVREAATVNSDAIGSLNYAALATVLSGAVFSDDGIEWYRVNSEGLTGWIAGDYCELYQSAGAAFLTVDAGALGHRISAMGVQTGDFLKAHKDVSIYENPVGGSQVIGVLYTNQQALVTTAHSIDRMNGITFLPVSTRFAEGWVDAGEIGKEPNPENLFPNPTATVDLNGISAMNGAVITRETKDGDWAVKCVANGSTGDQGLRFSSDTLTLDGRRVFGACVDVVGTGSLDNVKLRIMYSDGSPSLYSFAAPPLTLSATEWKRIFIPAIESSSGKIVSKVELWIRRNSATAQTFWADNAIVSSLN